MNRSSSSVIVCILLAVTFGCAVARQVAAKDLGSNTEHPASQSRMDETFQNFGSIAVNDSFQIAFVANDSTGLFWADYVGEVRAIALVGQEAPGTQGGRFALFTDPAINTEGEIAFLATITGGAARRGIFLFSDGETRPVVLEGNESEGEPPPTGLFSRLSPPALNDLGDVAFFAKFSLPQGSLETGLFIFWRGLQRLIIVSLDFVPLLNNGSLAPVGSIPAINNKGEVVFQAFVSLGPSGVREGIFRVTYGQSTDFGVVALNGQEMPQGGRFVGRFYRLVSINDQGEIAVEARAEIDGKNDLGIFLLSNREWKAVALPDQTLDADNRIGTVYESTPVVNNLRQVAFRALVIGANLGDGIVLAEDGRFLPVALPSQEVPESGGGEFSKIGPPALSNNGDVIFAAQVCGGTFTEGIFLYSGGMIRPMVTSNTPLP